MRVWVVRTRAPSVALVCCGASMAMSGLLAVELPSMRACIDLLPNRRLPEWVLVRIRARTRAHCEGVSRSRDGTGRRRRLAVPEAPGNDEHGPADAVPPVVRAVRDRPRPGERGPDPR